MDVPVTRPSNRFLIRERDRRWPRVLSIAIGLGAVVVITLFLVGWPRLRSTSLHYEILLARDEVRELESTERALRLELERERDPNRLAERARALGLTSPSLDAFTTLTADGSAP